MAHIKMHNLDVGRNCEKDTKYPIWILRYREYEATVKTREWMWNLKQSVWIESLMSSINYQMILI